MSRRLALGLVAVTGLLLVAALVLLTRDRPPAPPARVVVDPSVPLAPAQLDDVETVEVQLYFPGDGSQLWPQTAELPASDDPAVFATGLVAMLLEGPDDPTLTRLFQAPPPVLDTEETDPDAIPEPTGDAKSDDDPAVEEETIEVNISSLHLGEDGVVFLDLHSEGLDAPPVQGSTNEQLTLFSIVQTLVANVPDAVSVVVLWNGRQRVTFAGHVDTTRPLLPDPSLLAPSG
jgi:hypothetical protein